MNMRLVESGTDAGLWSRVQRSAGRAWLTLLLIGFGSPAWALPIDLQLFFYYPGDPVVVGSTDGTAAGSFAVIGEDALLGSVVLSNDPGLGDPELIDSTEGPILRFEYEFTSDSVEECAAMLTCDGFLATLFDADPVTGGVIDGFLDDFWVDVTSSGVVEFALLTFGGGITFGLQFELLSFDGDDALGSVARISALEVYDPNTPPVDPPVSVPEPGSLSLLAAGIAGLLLRRRRQAQVAPFV